MVHDYAAPIPIPIPIPIPTTMIGDLIGLMTDRPLAIKPGWSIRGYREAHVTFD